MQDDHKLESDGSSLTGKKKGWFSALPFKRPLSSEQLALKEAQADLKKARREYSGRVRDAERKLRDAQSAQRHAIDDASGDLRAAERAHQLALQDVQNRLNDWLNPGRGRKLGGYVGLTLYEHELVMPQGRCPTAGAQATVEAGRGHESYLLVKTTAVSGAFSVPPDGGLKARQFAAQVNSVALWELDFLRQRQNTIPQLRAELATVQRDVAAIDAARERLANVEADADLVILVETAQQDLTRTKADTAELNHLQAHVNELSRLAGKPAVTRNWLSGRRLLIGSLALILFFATSGVAIIATIPRPPTPDLKSAAATPTATETPAPESSATPWLYDPNANPTTPMPSATAITPTPPPASTPPSATATPAAAPAVPPPPPAPAPPPARNTCGAAPNPWGYNFCGGSVISNPPQDFCNYFNCIPSFWKQTNGYVIQCADETYSHSGGRSGSCSSHHGDGRTLYQ